MIEVIPQTDLEELFEGQKAGKEEMLITETSLEVVLWVQRTRSHRDENVRGVSTACDWAPIQVAILQEPEVENQGKYLKTFLRLATVSLKSHRSSS